MMDSVPVFPPPFLSKTASVFMVARVDRSSMGFVIRSMLINMYSESQEDSPSGPTANSSFRSSLLQQKLKTIKDASGEGEGPSV